MLSLDEKLALLDEYLEQFTDEEFATRLDSHSRVGPTAIDMLKSFESVRYDNRQEFVPSHTIYNPLKVLNKHIVLYEMHPNTYAFSDLINISSMEQDSLVSVAVNDENYAEAYYCAA